MICDKSVLKRVLGYFLPYWPRLMAVGVSLLIVSSVHLARPLILREIIDKAIAAGDIDYAIRMALLFVGCLIVGAVALYVRVLIMSRLGAEVVADIKKQVFSNFLDQGMKFFDNFQVGKLVNRIESDANHLKTMFSHAATALFSSFILLAGILIIITVEAPWLGLIALLSMVAISVVLFWYVRYIRNIYRQVREKNSELTGYLTEYLQGIDLIRIYRCEGAIKGNLEKLNDNKAAMERWACFVDYVLFSPAFRFWTEIGVLALVFLFGGREVLAGRMSVGTLIMFIELLRQFFRPLEMLIELIGQLQASMAAASRVFEMMDVVPDVVDGGVENGGTRFKGAIEFKNVNFSYKEELVLKDVSFTIKPSTKVAVVGPSGSGKTTCVNLLLRFYNLNSGEILADGRNITEMKIASWRKHIALVLQEIYLFPGTIMDNLKAFSPDVTDEQVISAARLIGAEEFILRQPEGYNAFLAERGANLSQGERQLLSYTRAMVKNPEILILDEATSSVDVITERILQESMNKLMQGRTSLIIAHRLSTIRSADNILVFSKGELVEQGSHEQLVSRGGLYKELVEIQTVSSSTSQDVASPRIPGVEGVSEQLLHVAL